MSACSKSNMEGDLHYGLRSSKGVFAKRSAVQFCVQLRTSTLSISVVEPALGSYKNNL